MAECKEKSLVSVEMKRDGAAAEEARMVINRKRKYCIEVERECGGEVESAANSILTAAWRTSGCSKVDGEEGGVAKRSWTEPDLEDVDSSSESFEVVAEISTSINGVFSREASSISELCGDSEDFSIQSPSPLRISVETPRRKLPSLMADDMPSAAELDDFFSTAEKLDQKRFAAKYNYDILKDVPLEGKYQWVSLRP